MSNLTTYNGQVHEWIWISRFSGVVCVFFFGGGGGESDCGGGGEDLLCERSKQFFLRWVASFRGRDTPLKGPPGNPGFVPTPLPVCTLTQFLSLRWKRRIRWLYHPPWDPRCHTQSYWSHQQLLTLQILKKVMYDQFTVLQYNNVSAVVKQSNSTT